MQPQAERPHVVPELHVGPYQPGLQRQTSGETHSPPFSQCLLHTTGTDERLAREGSCRN